MKNANANTSVENELTAIETLAYEADNAYMNGEITFNEAMWSMKKILAHVDRANAIIKAKRLGK